MFSRNPQNSQRRKVVDSGPPSIYPHLELKLKQFELEDERLRRIDRENHRLVSNLVRTEVTRSKFNHYSAPPHSINKSSRGINNAQQKQENELKLMKENERLVGRILRTSGYDVKSSLPHLSRHLNNPSTRRMRSLSEPPVSDEEIAQIQRKMKFYYPEWKATSVRKSWR